MSETATMTLTEFLSARLDEDEAAARAERDRYLSAHGPVATLDEPPSPFLWSRVLADVEAKRRIVADFGPDYGMGVETPDQKFVLRTLALPYRDHPDYDPTWAPTEQERP